jgi:phosphoribosylformylglycinamidine synthase PurS subunit
MKATVIVRPKQGILDPQGEAVRTALDHLGFPVAEARIGRVIELTFDDGDDARGELEKMCRQLLANPLIESYEIELEGDSGTEDDGG